MAEKRKEGPRGTAAKKKTTKPALKRTTKSALREGVGEAFWSGAAMGKAKKPTTKVGKAKKNPYRKSFPLAATEGFAKTSSKITKQASKQKPQLTARAKKK